MKWKLGIFLCVTVVLSGCGSSNKHNQWTWESGSDSANASGTYGSKGSSSSSNAPGARMESSGWKDSSGNLWLFGGEGYNSSASGSVFNDLWKYTPDTNTWTWMDGSNTSNQAGNYGTLLTATTSNVPGARSGAANWTDSDGNFWLFGGEGYDASGNTGTLNDMWTYDSSTKEWTWMKGDNTVGQSGVYGTQGTSAESNTPGSRYRSSTWTDTGGDLWLFGGGEYNDLWVYIPNTNRWTWISGSNSIGQSGSYGTKGVAGLNNIPGSRYGAVTWSDSSNNFWLYGGYGLDANGDKGFLGDLWKYNISTNEWTWIKGNSTLNYGGSYGTQGNASSSNYPGSRIASVSWIDSDGNLWLFGGEGYDSNSSEGYLNDLWKYTPSSSQWTWIGGSSVVNNSTGTYGTKEKGSKNNIPGSRLGSIGWTDSSNNFWLMGGYYYFGSINSENGYLNDLWKYTP